ncbi:MAG: DUF5717 family protein [Defluviitaleaceae bacterium]|nr:DUF5717 family protein [Defluviitaleaceae bacterium]
MDIREALEYPLPVLSVSKEEIVIEANIESNINSNKSYEASFELKNFKGGILSGKIISPVKSLTFEPNTWEGNRQTVVCRFSPDPMECWKPGEVHTFSTLILSNGGEFTLPITVRLAKMAINTLEGITIANLQDFYDYAQKFPQKAQKLFTDIKFPKLLSATNFLYIDAYSFLAKEANYNQARAMDNFFILAGLKNRTKLQALTSTKEHISKIKDDNMIYGAFMLQKSDIGYVDAHISALNDSPWISLSSNTLNTWDFDDNLTAMIKYSIDPMQIRGRYACERILITAADTEDVPVDIIFKRPAPIKTWLTREGYKFQDEGFIVVENQLDEPLILEFFCKEQFVRFYQERYKVEGRLSIPFLIKLSPLQSAQMLFRKVPSLSAEIEIRTIYSGTVIRKVLTLTAGEW